MHFWHFRFQYLIEISAHKNVARLYDLAKKLDPGRIVTCANLYPMKAQSKLNQLTDMVGYNIYFGWYYGKMQDYGPYLDRLHDALPDVPLGISEYGVDADVRLHSETPLVKDYSEEFQALFHETVYPQIEARNYLWGSFVWNMFDFSSARRDEGGQKYINAKGLVTYDRKVKKDAFFYYKAKWSAQPFLHICEKRFEKRCCERLNIKVYTNLPEAVLTRESDGNAKAVTARNLGNGKIVFSDILLRDGRNTFKVSGRAKDGTHIEDVVTYERTKYPERSYQLPENEAGTTVQNWFLNEDGVNTEQYYSIKDRAEDLLENEACRRILSSYLPEVTALLEKGVIPMGLALISILSRDKEIDKRIDVKAMNLELMKIVKES